jgi:hypothetical protein
MTNRSEATPILGVRTFGALLSAAIAILATSALAQAPTQAQRNAIKSQCRSDYVAHCSNVKPGGIEALQCLQTNMASLSPACQTAVRAVEAPAKADAAPAAPKAEPAPAAATNSETPAPPSPAPKAEPSPAAAVAQPATPATTASKPAAPTASPTAGRPSNAQIAAIRSACRSDYPTVCAGVPTGGAQALQCLQKNKARVAARCQQALDATGGSAATAATAPAAVPARPLVLRPMRPREVVFVLRSACGADVRMLCAGIDPGGGRVLQCLTTNASSLSPACRRVLSQFAAR